MTSFYRDRGKRLVDVALAAAGLVLTSPLIASVAAAVRTIDGPPVFFFQNRIGLDGREFVLIKFRTMSRGAEKGSSVTARSDPRITRLGSVLRRFKLDELPQLWNVLCGDMSLVGPRPDVPGYADCLTDESRRVLSIRPGITGPATIAFRNEEALLAQVANPKEYNDKVIFPQKVRINLQYIDQYSLGLDLYYLLATVLPALESR